MRDIGRKRNERSGLGRNVERLGLIDAERTAFALLAGGREEHHHGDAPRKLLITVRQHIAMPSIESAGEISKKTRAFVARQGDIEESSDQRTHTGDRTLDLLRGGGVNVHFHCSAHLTIDNEPVGMDFGGCYVTAFHGSTDAVAPVSIPEVRKKENSVQRWHVPGESGCDRPFGLR